ncbi:hypothetical protein BV22DRAFT_1196502 [Leucogyrophana mollusca]|uniref:Uncharacterized protein n=1 Tax=Leucogyrophana mollusca TaxID=85980 RepID=A0ACB8BFV4_9AGAM|nr:hypothetical protein BV22DRAFT_1196502 [Leucogyrophana mollusca]
MDQFRKIFKKSPEHDGSQSLKHSRSMPLRGSSKSKAAPLHEENSRPVYRGKTPLKTSDIVYVEQGPGMLDIERTAWMSSDNGGRGESNAYRNLLGQFPDPPTAKPPPVPPRSPLRATSLNTSQVPTITLTQPTLRRERTVQRASSVACFSRPTATAYPALATKALPPVPKEDPRGRTQSATRPREPRGSEGMAGYSPNSASERSRTQSHAARPARAQAAHPYPQTHPPISRSGATASRANLRHSPSAATLGSKPSTSTPRRDQPLPYMSLAQCLDASTRASTRRAPLAPPTDPNTPEHMRPLVFDWDDPTQLKVGYNTFAHAAISTGRPLHVRDNGVVRRTIEGEVHKGCVPDEVGDDWYLCVIKGAGAPLQSQEAERRERERQKEQERLETKRRAEIILKQTYDNWSKRTGVTAELPPDWYRLP